jgi:signal transduction histidine kinase
VHVELGADSVRILLRIIDDGLGFDVRHVAHGLGLPSMRERVRSVGGSIDITSRPKLGTRVEVRVPFPGGGSEDIPQVA